MTTIKLRRGTATEWTTANPILVAGEMGIETDTRKFKFGDGTTPWNTLAYASAEGGGGSGDSYTKSETDVLLSEKNDNIFDIGKFKVVGSPTITDYGVASGFSTNTNYIQVPINPEGNFILDFEVNIGEISDIGSQIIYDALGFYKYGTDWKLHYPANGKLFATVPITENSKIRFIIKKDNLTITTKYSVNNGEFISLKQFVLTDNTNTERYLSIGKKGAGFSIDLKQFSITVDGKEVFNGLMNSTKPIYDKITSTNTELSKFKTDTDNNFSAVNSALNEKANLSDLGLKQNILSDGNGTKIVDNKVDINQGIAGIQGLSLYQNNGTITKDNDLNITFDNGACGYIFLENKGANNDYEIVLHSNYLNKKGPADDCNINGVRCLPQAVLPTPGGGAQGECWFDTFISPFRVVAVPNGGSVQTQTVDNINYIKYIIKGTNLTISYSSTGEAYTELYTIAISSTYVINVCIADSPWQNDIGGKWTKTTLYSDSYILDKTTNTYLMKQGTTNEGVAVATSNKYGLVLPDNSTIVSNNGVMSVVPSTIAGYSMPSNRYIDLTLGASGSTYTAPANGWFSLSKVLGTANQYNCLSNEFTGYKINTSGATGMLGIFLPAKKGDIITASYTSTGAVQWFRFIYAEGAQ